MTKTDKSIRKALETFGRIKRQGEECLIVRRPDHPHIDGDYFYAIRPSEKRLWTATEKALSQDEIASLWYAADCPPV